MDQDEYVETSDVEELADAYALRRWSDFEDVIKGGQLTPIHSQTVRSPKTETLRKRRKLSHGITEETRVSVSSSQTRSHPQNETRSPHFTSQYGISDKGKPDTDGASENAKVKIRGDQDPGLQARTHVRKVIHMDDTAVMEHVKAWTSSSSPRKAAELQNELQFPPGLRPSQRSGDEKSLDQLSLSLQDFSKRPLSYVVQSAKSQTRRNVRAESEDELAVAKLSPPLRHSEIRTSELHQLDATRVDTPSNLSGSSSLVPVESSQLRAEDHDAQDAATSNSLRISTIEARDVEHIALNRYPLRRRQPNQLRPYSYDELYYKTILKDNPAAIINGIRHKHRAYHQEDHYQEDDDYVQEESQHQDVSDEHETQEDLSLVAQPLPSYIQPLSESDDGDSDGLAQEVCRIERDRRRRERETRGKKKQELKQKEEEKRWAQQHLRREKEASRVPRRFPVSTPLGRRNSHATDILSPPRIQYSQTNSPQRSVGLPPAQSSLSSKGTSELDVLRDYFMNNLTASPISIEGDIQTPEPESLQDPFTSSAQLSVQKNLKVTDIEDKSPVTRKQHAKSSDPGTGTSEEEEPLDIGKRYHELFRLYPVGYARELLKDTQHHRSRRLVIDDLQEGGPLLPGQSRIRRVVNSNDVRDIRGDSESDESQVEPSLQYTYDGDIRDFLHCETRSDTVSGLSRDGKAQNTASSQPIFRDPVASVPETIEISDEAITSSGEEEQVDDEDIQALLGDDDAGTIYEPGFGNGSMKEESMIDWMLSRTRIVGPSISKARAGGRKQSRSHASGHSSNAHRRYKYDVKTRDACKFGSERQTLLSFENHATSQNTKNGKPRAGVATEPTEIAIGGLENGKRKSWKARRKELRGRHKLRGVYSMANPYTSEITSGRSKKPMKITIDLDDANFYQSFAAGTSGLTSARSEKPKLPSFHVDDDIDHRNQELGYSQHPLVKRPRDSAGKCTVDMGIDALSPGVSFSPTSYMREGHLHDLIHTLTSDQALQPSPLYLCEINLSPSQEIATFLQNLDKIFEGLLDLISDIPSEGYEEKIKDWGNLSRSACRYITWLCTMDPLDRREQLGSFVKNKVLSIISILKPSAAATNTLNIALLSLNWFCLEASIRSGYRLFDVSSGPLDFNPAHASARLLLYRLVEYGTHIPYKTTKKNQIIDETKIPSYAAQIWVCLIHLLPVCDARQNTNPKSYQDHPLWVELLTLHHTLPSINCLETCERIWEVVFALMVLSQFSVFGIVGSSFHISSSWSLIAFAIKQSQLAQGSGTLQHLGCDTLEKRDKYTRVMISRCYRLSDYWKWDMEQSFGALNQLVDIFRARNFINLQGEEAEYPDFMLNGDWDFLSQSRSDTDSAFTSTLKLIKRAVDADCLTEPEIKKMVALIIPVSRFRVQKEKVPGANDLSPICNRFAALALVIAIDPEYATRTVKQVHSSIDFAASDTTTQLLTIRGVKLLATLMIKRDVPLQEVAKWLATIVKNVASELQSFRSSTTDQPNRRRDKTRNCSLLILSLYATGRAAMEAFASRGQYPEPTFLLAFKPFLESYKAIEETTHNLGEMRRFIESFLDARAMLSPPREPTLPNPQVDDPESQDYADFDFGIDLNDPTTLAQLDDTEDAVASVKEKEQGELADKVIFPFFWASCWKIQKFCATAAEPVVHLNTLRTLDSWAHCFGGCMHILIQHGKVPSRWNFCLDEMETFWRKIRVGWLSVRVRVAIYSEIIRYDPGFYGLRTHELLETFFESLATHDLTAEPRYWRYVVANEVNHNPLFKDVTESLFKFSAQIDPQPDEINQLRISLLTEFFRNVDLSLRESSETRPQSSMYIDMCLKFFSRVRTNSQEFSTSPELSVAYGAWCKDILGLLDDYPLLKSHPRLKTILDLLS